jgi:hypothetical protein
MYTFDTNEFVALIFNIYLIAIINQTKTFINSLVKQLKSEILIFVLILNEYIFERFG